MSSGTQVPNSEGPSFELRERKGAAIEGSNTNGIPNGVSHESEQKEQTVTWGRTPDGTGTQFCEATNLIVVFPVPQTHDVFSSIFNPKKPKSFLDLLILAVLALQIAIFILLPPAIRRITSLVIFLLWRTAYDLGLGYLLHEQSVRRALIAWVKDHHIFDPNYDPSRYAFIKRQIVDKMGDDYDFEKVPIEFNTWLLFRRLVDLILINDFLSYALFAIAWIHFPNGHWVVHTLRWSAGWVLAFFNIWVKIDAHRVVKDFAWCRTLIISSI